MMRQIVPQELIRAANAKAVWKKLRDAFPLRPRDSSMQRAAEFDEVSEGATNMLPFEEAALGYWTNSKLALRPIYLAESIPNAANWRFVQVLLELHLYAAKMLEASLLAEDVAMVFKGLDPTLIWKHTGLKFNDSMCLQKGEKASDGEYEIAEKSS
ncbi:hypothetical protein SBRCBS47491_003130 [Sporothrix bragantina]|uniref:Uncharacterized protein n=1 Tax=Sporothrix bragantina TaxID=671064 RepID=A0ABP0BCP2_9PEZI